MLKQKWQTSQDDEGLLRLGTFRKSWFYGLKLHLTTDLNRNLLAVRITPTGIGEREVFKKMNEDMLGIFVTDAGYVSDDLAQKFHIERKRILFAKSRANMKKIITEFQKKLYDTRMIIELNF